MNFMHLCVAVAVALIGLAIFNWQSAEKRCGGGLSDSLTNETVSKYTDATLKGLDYCCRMSINCTTDVPCNNTRIVCGKENECSINCIGNNSCNNIYIDGRHGRQLNVIFNTSFIDDSLIVGNNITIICPTGHEYANCKVFCQDSPNTCSDKFIDITSYYFMYQLDIEWWNPPHGYRIPIHCAKIDDCAYNFKFRNVFRDSFEDQLEHRHFCPETELSEYTFFQYQYRIFRDMMPISVDFKKLYEWIEVVLTIVAMAIGILIGSVGLIATCAFFTSDYNDDDNKKATITTNKKRNEKQSAKNKVSTKKKALS